MYVAEMHTVKKFLPMGACGAFNKTTKETIGANTSKEFPSLWEPAAPEN